MKQGKFQTTGKSMYSGKQIHKQENYHHFQQSSRISVKLYRGNQNFDETRNNSDQREKCVKWKTDSQTGNFLQCQ